MTDKTPEEMRRIKALCMSDIDADLHRKLNDTYQLAKKYAEHVYSGGDPTEHPHVEGQGRFGGSWYNSPLGPYAMQIVNSYRLAMGKPANPYHPGGPVAFDLFDILVSAPSGQWQLGQALRKVTRNGHVETWLKQYTLKQAGYVLQKETINGKVHFRLMPYSEVTGVKEAANA